jgi:hypothetical protein
VDRRRFLLTSVAGVLATPLAAEGQRQQRVHRIGVLLPLGVTLPILTSFLAGMRDRGWVENQSFVAEPRYAEGKLERLPELATSLVRLKVDGSSPWARRPPWRQKGPRRRFRSCSV